MYKDIEKIMLQTNGNHFGFDGMQITEMAQYTEYPEGGFMIGIQTMMLIVKTNHQLEKYL